MRGRNNEAGDVAGMPALTYTFGIERVWLETTPWIEDIDFAGQRSLRRKPGSRTFREIRGTDAWSDDRGRAHYVLDCEIVSGPRANRGEPATGAR